MPSPSITPPRLCSRHAAACHRSAQLGTRAAAASPPPPAHRGASASAPSTDHPCGGHPRAGGHPRGRGQQRAATLVRALQRTAPQKITPGAMAPRNWRWWMGSVTGPAVWRQRPIRRQRPSSSKRGRYGRLPPSSGADETALWITFARAEERARPAAWAEGTDPSVGGQRPLALCDQAR